MSCSRPPAFELRVIPDENDRFRLALWQRTLRPNGSAEPKLLQLATLKGRPLQLALDQILDVLRREGHRPTVLRPGRSASLPIGEEAGVRLTLLFLALRPLAKTTRIEAVVSGIAAMPIEEAYYWFSKCLANGSGRQARHALRVLLAPE